MLTEDQKAALIKRHATTYRNRHVETKALGFTEADLNALIADVEQAVRQEMDADSARLDWIGHQSLEDLAMGLVIDAPHDGEYYVSGDDGRTGYGLTLRAAIDAAIGEKVK
jgi:hypothetical protein